MTATANPVVKVEDVVDCMRSIQTEHDRWRLAEELHVLIPKGQTNDAGITFAKIIDAATSEGVAGKLSENTLRLYRDTANRWPEDKRVPNVSFSAHREAMVLPTLDAAARMLKDLAKNNGPDKVTVATVRKAVAVKQGKVTPQPAAKPSSTSVDILADLVGGASKTIAAIPNDIDSAQLDKVYAGLQKAIAHVERLRAKAQRRADKAKNPVNKPVGNTKKAVAPAAKDKAGAGDMRGL